MSTYFNTQVGKEIGYDLQFHTEDRKKYEFMQEAARRCIDNKIVPLADVTPVVHAHWITCNRLENNIYIDDNEFFRCSSCFHDVKKKTCYCSNCGSKMDEKENEE